MTTVSERTGSISTGRGALGRIALSVLAADLVVVVLAVVVASGARQSLGVFDNPAPDVAALVGAVGPLIILVWIAAVALLGGYRADVFGASTEEYKRVLNAGLLTSGITGIGCYLAKVPLSRGYFLLVFLIGVPATLLTRWALRRALHRIRRRGALLQRVVIVGSVAHIDEIAAVLRRDLSVGYDVLGALTPAHSVVEETSTGVPVLGNAEDVVAVAHDARADAILFAGGGLASAQQLREIIWDLEHDQFRVVVAPSVSEVSGDRISVRPVAGLPLMHIEKPSWFGAARAGKRLFDVAGALAVLVALSPVIALCAVWVRSHDVGPVLFRQTRVGRDGATFACLKFRTMDVDAEDRLAELHREAAFEGGLFKLRQDPRVTGPGRWLRRFSLDELPQLLNVVRGEMSLVGPRPPLPAEVVDYAGRTSRRLRVRPGMTGLWQVSGRSDLSFEESVRLDLYYVDNWSMLQDLSILLRTLGAVLSSRGAY